MNSNLINLVKELASFKKIIQHIDISLGKTSQNLVILIEKEYVDRTSKDFLTKILKNIKEKYPFSKVIEYAVSQNLKKVTYFIEKKPILKKELDRLFNSNPKFIDFIHTGRAFYKQSPLKSGVVVVRLSSKNTKLFSYGKLITTMLNKKSSITSKYLKTINNFSVGGLNIKIPTSSFFYSGFGNSSLCNLNSNFRILPMNTITGFLKNPNDISMKNSSIVINGTLEKDGYVENINKKLNLKGQINLSIKKNKINSLMVDSKVVKLDKYHKIVHLTFGTNPV